MESTRSLGYKQLLYMVPLGICASLGLNCFISILRLTEFFPSYTEQVYEVLFSRALPTGLIMYGFVMPGIEELLFRWILFDKLTGFVPVKTAGIISSVIFGVYHRNTVQFLYSFVFGLLLAYCFWIFNSILASWILHGSANVFIYLISSLEIFSFFDNVFFKALGMAAGFAGTFFLLRLLMRYEKKGRGIYGGC